VHAKHHVEEYRRVNTSEAPQENFNDVKARYEEAQEDKMYTRLTEKEADKDFMKAQADYTLENMKAEYKDLKDTQQYYKNCLQHQMYDNYVNRHNKHAGEFDSDCKMVEGLVSHEQKTSDVQRAHSNNVRQSLKSEAFKSARTQAGAETPKENKLKCLQQGLVSTNKFYGTLNEAIKDGRSVLDGKTKTKGADKRWNL
jgi:hypothetical protein